jgi:hypothetical protein
MRQVNAGISRIILFQTIFRIAAGVANSFERFETDQLHIF